MKDKDYMNTWGETVIADTSDYEPELVFDEEAKAVVCSVCRRTPKFVGFGNGAGHWSCSCVHDCRDDRGRETCAGCAGK